MTRTARVALAGRGYDVVIGPDLIDEVGPRVAPMLARPQVTVVTDETVDALHGRRLSDSLARAGVGARAIVVPPGEEQKSFSGLERLCGQLLTLEVERGDIIIAFGGGVVGDLAGFAAAILKRGVDFVQVPTTLLAQVDSSVGGKTAIDTPHGKNLIGAFHQPRLVVADLALLDGLPEREMRCGYAEVLKYGLLGDADFFAWLEGAGARVLAREPGPLGEAVARSVAMKADIVARDEREGGVRALLNLGHSFAHALEAESGYGEALKHGEAVAVGCAMAFRLSTRLGLCSQEDSDRTGRAIAAAGLPARLADLAGHPFKASSLLTRLTQDKKAKAGRLTLILARGIGGAFVADAVDPAAVTEFLLAEGAQP